MPFNVTREQTLIAAGCGAAFLSVLGAMIWLVRRASYAEGKAQAVGAQLGAIIGAQFEGDEDVAKRRDPKGDLVPFPTQKNQ